MPIASALFEEMLEDTRRLTAQLMEYGDRWSTYGEQLVGQASESQIAEIKAVMREFIEATQSLDKD